MRNDERGLTLVEVLAAAVILGIAVILFSNISGYTLLSANRSHALTDARSVAERELHQARTTVKSTGSAPADRSVDGFLVDYDLSSSPDGAASGPARNGSFTLQAIVFAGGTPQWLSVTVAKEGS